jgi:iron complex outermembrane recepter protein
MNTPYFFRRVLVLAATVALLSPPLRSQSTSATPVRSAADAKTEPVVELSPFEVKPDDVGYQAANTTSGSRLNSRLKDTPAAISAFTPEFLSDIGATNLEDMLGYATNIEADFDDTIAGFGAVGGRSTSGNEFNFRMRGMMANASRDYVDNGASTDLYNIERAEVASGPNSVLFGMGAAGGLVSLQSKKATLNRTQTKLKGIVGSWDYRRVELDHNHILIPKKLSVRLLGLYHNAQGWKKYEFQDDARLMAAVTVKPLANTTIHTSFEWGESTKSGYVPGNAGDQITRWLAAGRPILDGAASTATGTARLNQTADRFTFDERSGIMYNLKGELQSTTLVAGNALVPTSLMPYEYSLTGPGSQRPEHFKNYQVQLEQRVTKDFAVELAYFHNETDIFIDAMNISGGFIDLRGDPNLTVPHPNGSAATVANPRAGQLYLEQTWFNEFTNVRNDIVRATASYDLDLGKWFGRHRIAGLIENSKQDRLRRYKSEILVDQNNVPISDVANPEGTLNQFFRRTYVTEGDFGTYYGGNAEVPVPAFTYNGRQINARFVSRPKSNTSTVKDIDSFMLASQSFWLKDRLVTTLGYRLDRITFKNATDQRIVDPNDPRVRSRQIVLNEWDFTGATETDRYQPKTFSLGAVGHVTKRLSLFYNQSKNTGTPRFDRTVAPLGNVPPPTEGRSKDYGVMIDVLGDERFFARATIFDTAQLNDAMVIPNGTTTPSADSFGGENLFAIIDALRAKNRISAAAADAQRISFNAGTIDVFDKGVEVEFVANPTRNLTLRATYSYSKRRRDNFYKEIFAFYRPKYDEWRAAAAGDAALLTLVNQQIDLIESDMADQVDAQDNPFATRPDKASGTGRYRFSEGRLRGAFIGGGLRYQGKNYVQRDAATGRIYWGNEMLLADAFAGYRVKLPWLKSNLLVQLNVKNVSNSYRVGVGRYNSDFTQLRRIYLTPPRSYRLSTTLEF